MPELSDLPRALPALRVAVVGDALLDRYREGTLRGTCREAPAPKVGLQDEHDAAGGAANVAVSVAAMGARTRFVGLGGDDGAGESLTARLAAAGVDAGGLVREPGRRTHVKERIVAEGRLLARLDHGDAGSAGPAAAAALAEAIAAAARWADVLVVADYEAGCLDARARRALERCARDARVRVVDSARLAAWRGLAPHAVTPNAGEALALLGAADAGRAPDMPRRERLARRGAWLRRATGAQAVMTTLDEDGVLVMPADAPVTHVPVRAVPGASAVGAGDVFTAVVACALGAGWDPVAAARAGGAAAAAAVGRGGTAVARRTDLAPAPATVPDGTPEAVAARIAARRSAGARVVLTNGCFDLLHAGHVALLERARAHGDMLVVALNDDAGVRRLKGEGRPVLTLDARRRVMAALECVDEVVVFGGDTACEVVRALAPDVYVKAVLPDDPPPPEAATARSAGAEVLLLAPEVPGSTREVIRRIAGAHAGT